MLQPFERFSPLFIDRLIQLKARYLVSQTYGRALEEFTPVPRTPLLLTDYDNPGAANIHWNAVKQDRYAAVLDLENGIHKKKLLEMSANHSTYELFWSVVRSKKALEQRINLKYKDHLRRYIERTTNWRIGSNHSIRPSVEVSFGEVFITLRHSGQRLRIKFEEIENS